MNWEPLARELQQMMKISFNQVEWTHQEWNNSVQRTIGESESAYSAGDRMYLKDEVHYFLYQDQQFIHSWMLDANTLSPREQLLVEFIIRQKAEAARKPLLESLVTEESRADEMRKWLLKESMNMRAKTMMPQSLYELFDFEKAMIPILLSGVQNDENHVVSYEDFKSLLQSFFDEELILIPVRPDEWLILGPIDLLEASTESEMDVSVDSSSLQESLTEIALGLFEMLASEWMGDCHLSIECPMNPRDSLLDVYIQLHQTIKLGLQLNRDGFYMPWKYRYEQMISTIPDSEKLNYLNHIFGTSSVVTDEETLSTLQTYFEQDCNVSETAKQLYIHRNTLVYRLDRFKQESGFDVRSFEHAVMVKTALLLYKVTKN